MFPLESFQLFCMFQSIDTIDDIFLGLQWASPVG